mgnify:CR=1 FL=1
MVILEESSDSQVFRFIPTRFENANTMMLRNETTNLIITESITCIEGCFYLYFDKVFNLKENHFYEIILKYDDILVHRDRIFCTNQPVLSYSVNKDEYIATNDNIIFYE